MRGRRIEAWTLIEAVKLARLHPLHRARKHYEWRLTVGDAHEHIAYDYIQHIALLVLRT